MADDYLIAQLTGGARRVLHHPVPREVVVIHDRPWKKGSDLSTLSGKPVRLRFVLKDADLCMRCNSALTHSLRK